MTFSRAFPLVLALAVLPLGAAMAQFGGMPGMPGSPGMPGGPGPGAGSPFGAQPQQPPPACQKLMGLRDEMQKNGQALQAAGQKKAAPDELCKLFNAYLAAGRKMVKGLEEGASVCGVPPELPIQIKAQQAKESQMAKQICEVAARPRPTGPSLSDALGTTPVVPDTTATKRGPGTFDTLENSPLLR
jgi:hypothetical protein